MIYLNQYQIYLLDFHFVLNNRVVKLPFKIIFSPLHQANFLQCNPKTGTELKKIL
jgi:hypothetical protein